MIARPFIVSQEREGELSELSGQMLEINSLAEARMLALRLVSAWLGTDCNFWVKEPRSLRPLTPADEPLMATLQPIDMMKLGESVAVQRRHNPFLELAIKHKVVATFCPTDVLPERVWSGNPFRNEVCMPLGAAKMIAIEVDEEPKQTDTFFVMVAGREKRSFSAQERYWFERIKWTVQPVIQHLQHKRMRDALTDFGGASSLVTELPFTPRESEVFHWMLEGKRNKEIASILACSPSTIKKHVASILIKTGAETRAGALRALFKA